MVGEQEIDTKKAVDIVERIVYKSLKEHGFSKHGRTLHRFVSEDISQVISFQGSEGLVCVNTGIRVPECVCRTFHVDDGKDDYYKEYDCNIRSRLETIVSGIDKWYDPKQDPNALGEYYLEQIKKHILPVFDILNSREAILEHRRDYPEFDDFRHLILLEEAMIYGNCGNMEKAAEFFNKYYHDKLSEYNYKEKYGTQKYLHAGETLVYKNQTIVAEKDGYYTVYGGNYAHIEYLEKLAEKLGIHLTEQMEGTNMNFTEIANTRQSCRSYDATRGVEKEKINAILEAARLAPSACNGQPYLITVCEGEKAKEVAKATMGMGMNKFAADAPVCIVISEEPYVKTAALGAKVKGNDYRSIDIGIVTAYITAEATVQGLGTCILGWLDDDKIRKICDIKYPVRLVITLGYAKDDDKLREKKRKDMDKLVSFK